MKRGQRPPSRGLVTKRCLCSGLITADPADPLGAVTMHNRSPVHEAWRLGYRLVPQRVGALTADGRPIFRLEER